MWENLLRVDWGRLSHAYGWAHDVPRILLDMVSADEETRSAAWDNFWGVVNHQGDFYDSTVAAVPFLIDAAGRPETPGRVGLLDYCRERWLNAPEYGGDPILPEPPGGVDEPTPLRDGSEIADQSPDESEEEFDVDSYRRMDLCAWQTGRAILAGRPVFEDLLADPDRQVAAAAGTLLLIWPETRAVGKRALIRAIEDEPDPVEKGRWILEFGVYGTAEDAANFERWVAPGRPALMRAAAALAWAWVAAPDPLPGPAARALGDPAVVDGDAFARLPWEGLWHRGPWLLPANAADLILRLAAHGDDDVRWRAVQGLAVGRETAKHLPAARVVPVLIDRLADPEKRVREAAALALASRGESICEIAPGVVPALIRALGDASPSVCGHAARGLAAMPHRLSWTQRAMALAAIDRASRRFAKKSKDYVQFDSMGVQAAPFLVQQHGYLRKPANWDVPELLAESAFPRRQDGRLVPLECDRRLAEHYARSPEGTMAAAIGALGDPHDRNTAIGAARWLMTLGPAAAPALGALDAMGAGELDPYAREQARTAGAFIRASLLVEPDPEAGAKMAPGEDPSRLRIASLARQLGGSDSPAPGHATVVPALIDGLGHTDPYVRARSAEILASLSPQLYPVADAAPWLARQLGDEAAAEVGLAGRFECEGRIYHWRRERRSPRAAAIRALFQIAWVWDGGEMLDAMVAESRHAVALCGGQAVPTRFAIGQWRSAVAAAGGLGVADPKIRAARQRCREAAWSGTDTHGSASACQAELAEVIRQLSGRLV